MKIDADMVEKPWTKIQEYPLKSHKWSTVKGRERSRAFEAFNSAEFGIFSEIDHLRIEEMGAPLMARSYTGLNKSGTLEPKYERLYNVFTDMAINYFEGSNP